MSKSVQKPKEKPVTVTIPFTPEMYLYLKAAAILHGHGDDVLDYCKHNIYSIIEGDIENAGGKVRKGRKAKPCTR